MQQAEGVYAVHLRIPGKVYKFVLGGCELGSMVRCPSFRLSVDAFESLAVALGAWAHCQDRYVVDVSDCLCVFCFACLDEVRVVEEIENWRDG